MKIGVYRIYLSQTWSHPRDRDRLARAFDAIPSFLYRIDAADPAALADVARTPHELRGHLRIAMTQSHVMLVDAVKLKTENRALAEEIALARAHFRRRIPILAVVPDEATPVPAAFLDAIDRIVEPDATMIACAIQELAEAAVANWRAPQAETDAADLDVQAPAQDEAPARPAGYRPLPLSEIAEALDTLRQRKSTDAPEPVA